MMKQHYSIMDHINKIGTEFLKLLTTHYLDRRPGAISADISLCLIRKPNSWHYEFPSLLGCEWQDRKGTTRWTNREAVGKRRQGCGKRRLEGTYHSAFTNRCEFEILCTLLPCLYTAGLVLIVSVCVHNVSFIKKCLWWCLPENIFFEHQIFCKLILGFFLQISANFALTKAALFEIFCVPWETRQVCCYLSFGGLLLHCLFISKNKQNNSFPFI